MTYLILQVVVGVLIGNAITATIKYFLKQVLKWSKSYDPLGDVFKDNNEG